MGKGNNFGKKKEIDQAFLKELATIMAGRGTKATLKGATLLSIISNQKVSKFRQTQDLDMDYAGIYDELILDLTRALRKSSKATVFSHIETTRLVDTSCSLTVYSRNNSILCEIDAQFKNNKRPVIYKVDNYEVKGQSIYYIITDKLTVVSDNGLKLSRRVKDLYDLFIISYLDSYTTTDIALAVTDKNSPKKFYDVIGNFNGLVNHSDRSKKGIYYAYSKFDLAYTTDSYSVEKPDFNTVVHRVLHFCEPFIMQSKEHLIWNPKKGVWNK